MLGQPGEGDPARFQVNEEQDVVGGETSPGEHFHREEGCARQNGHVRGDEVLPGGVLAPLWWGLDSISPKDVGYRLVGNRVAKIGKGSDDTIISPAGVLSGETDDERFKPRVDTGPAW